MEITIDMVKDSKILHEGTTCYILQYGEDFVYVVPESGERKRMQVESLRDCCVNGIGIVGFREWR